MGQTLQEREIMLKFLRDMREAYEKDSWVYGESARVVNDAVTIEEVASILKAVSCLAFGLQCLGLDCVGTDKTAEKTAEAFDLAISEVYARYA